MAKDKSKRAFPGQHDEEVVELVFHQHPIVMRKSLILGLLIILAGVIPMLIWPLYFDLVTKIALFTFLAVLVYWFYHWVGWYYTVYIVTDERLMEIKQKGLFSRKVTEYGLDKIQNINYEIKGFQAVLFQYGDIVAQTYVGDLEMKTIYKPVKIHSQLLEVWRKGNSGGGPADN